MKLLKNLGLILLAIWLVIRGLFSLIDASFPGLGLVLDILAIAAGALILYAVTRKNPLGNLGRLLLSGWLILMGLLSLLSLSFAGSGTVLAVLALAAGILLLVGR